MTKHMSQKDGQSTHSIAHPTQSATLCAVFCGPCVHARVSVLQCARGGLSVTAGEALFCSIVLWASLYARLTAWALVDLRLCICPCRGASACCEVIYNVLCLLNRNGASEDTLLVLVVECGWMTTGFYSRPWAPFLNTNFSAWHSKSSTPRTYKPLWHNCPLFLGTDQRDCYFLAM